MNANAKSKSREWVMIARRRREAGMARRAVALCLTLAASNRRRAALALKGSEK